MRSISFWRSEFVDRSLLLLAAVVAIIAGCQQVFGQSFSIHESPSPLVAKSPVSFSIHQATVEDVRNPIQFSVHELTAGRGDLNAGDGHPIANRVLVFVKSQATSQQVRQRVCRGLFCTYEWVTVAVPPTSSTEAKTSLQTLAEKTPSWRVSFDPADSRSHFVVIDIDDPANQPLVDQFQVDQSQVPVAIAELSGAKTALTGMDHVAIATWFNANHVADISATKAAQVKAFKAVAPTFGSSQSQWTYPGNIRTHLMDPSSPHHLPKAVIDQWSDQQCIQWHNWHHQVLSGKQASSSFLQAHRG